MERIFVMGGGGLTMTPDNLLLDQYILSLSQKEKPKICFLGTASGDQESDLAQFYDTHKTLQSLPSHLSLFKPHTQNFEDLLLEQDIIYVGGGSTFNLLCLWRAWGIDKILKKALSQGIILSGVSAGMLCWFEKGLSSSKGGELEFVECLGFLKGSACPHFDPTRKKIFLNSLRLLPGIALEDDCGAYFEDGVLIECVSSREGAQGYQIDLRRKSVENLSVRFLKK